MAAKRDKPEHIAMEMLRVEVLQDQGVSLVYVARQMDETIHALDICAALSRRKTNLVLATQVS